MPLPLQKTSYDGLANVTDTKIVDDKVIKTKDLNDPYRIMPSDKYGKKRMRKNQLITQERVKRGLELSTTSSTAEVSTGVWGYTFDGKNKFEGQGQQTLKYPYNNVEGAKAVNVFGKKNKMMSIKNSEEWGKASEVDQASHTIVSIPEANNLHSNHENINAEPAEVKELKQEDKIEIKSMEIPLGMRNATMEKMKADKRKLESLPKTNFRPKELENTMNASQDGKDRPKVFMDIKIGSQMAGRWGG